jgi:hypothetical protein
LPCGYKDWPTNPGWQTHVNLYKYTTVHTREREREIFHIYIYINKAIKLKHMLDYFKEKRNGNMLYYDVIEKQRYDW